jgi:deoxyribodipyrimidine photolyase-related protein
LEQRGIDASELGKPFPTSRSEALDLLGFFVDTKLERFGALEDAMYEESDYVYHSLLSVPLNLGLLSPSEVVTAIVETDAPLNSKE